LSECPLVRLDLSDNHIADIPNSFAQFKTLEFLNLKGNNLELVVDQSASKGIPVLIKYLEKRIETQQFAKNKEKKLKGGK
jgi:Leucine-rich repeat (LRR) protein